MTRRYDTLSRGFALYGFYGDNFKSHGVYRHEYQAERHRRALQVMEHQEIIMIELVRNDSDYEIQL